MVRFVVEKTLRELKHFARFGQIEILDGEIVQDSDVQVRRGKVTPVDVGSRHGQCRARRALQI